MNGEMGGEASHALTANEMPAHDHPFKFKNNWGWSSGTLQEGDLVDPSIYIWASTETKYNWITMSQGVGGNEPHNNMPPYLAVYIWKRTS